MDINSLTLAKSLGDLPVSFQKEALPEVETALTTKSVKVLNYLAEMDDVAVKCAVTMNPFCTCGILRKLLEQETEDLTVKIFVSKCKLCSGELLDIIVRQYVPNTVMNWMIEISNHPNVEIPTILYMMDMSWEFREYIGQNTARQGIMPYCNVTDLVKNPNCPKKLLEIIANSVSWVGDEDTGSQSDVEEDVAQNADESTDVFEILRKVDNDRNNEIKRGIMNHKNAPDFVKDILDKSDAQ